MNLYEDIDEKWIRKILHNRSERERFADALSGSNAMAFCNGKNDENNTADGKGKEPVYYVYGLFDIDQWENDIRVPFYIGKGIGQRVFSHGAEAIQYWADHCGGRLERRLKQEIKHIENTNESYDDLNVSPPEDQDAQDEEKRAKCERILACKNGIIEGVFKFGLYENEAYWVEDALIKAYNLINTNICSIQTDTSNSQHLLTNAIAGHKTAYEQTAINSSLDTIQTVDDVLKKIAIEPIGLQEIRERLNANKLLIIKIDESDYISAMQKYRGDEKRQQEKLEKWLRNRSRGYWNYKAEENEYAIVVLKGIGRILNIYKIIEFKNNKCYWIDLDNPPFSSTSEEDNIKECVEEYMDAPWQNAEENGRKEFRECLNNLYKAFLEKRLMRLTKIGRGSKANLVLTLKRTGTTGSSTVLNQ